MKKQSLRQKLSQLKKEISDHDHYYHVLDQPKITDKQYDKLFSRLLEIEKDHPEWITEDSPSQRVGGEPLKAFEKGSHRRPMLSLSNSFSEDEIVAFDKRLKRLLDDSSPIEYFCEPKFDGLAIELIYEAGKLTGAFTRGDGYVGEQVISNVKTIRMIPLCLQTHHPPLRLEVRGEIVMSKSDFNELNQKQQQAQQNLFANPRNAAAGSIRQLDPSVAASRPLKMFSHSIGVDDDERWSTQKSFLNEIKKWGLPTFLDATYESQPLIQSHQTIQGVLKHFKFIDSIRSQLAYNIDGLVIKVNSLALQKKIGYIARSPRWATAAKFKTPREITVIKDIVVRVGRTGAVTPVAIMEPVKVDGVTITQATLHNQDEIKRKDVRIGDTVIVQRAGDVIPEVVCVVKEKRKLSSRVFEFPENCPACQQVLELKKGEAVLRCENSSCLAIVKESLKHFVSKGAMNIDRLGDQLIESFVDNQLIYDFSDIYSLEKKQLLELKGFGQKSVDKLFLSIDKSRCPTFDKFIYALGIRFVGEQTARSLSSHFEDIDRLISSTESELLSIHDVGPRLAASIRDYFSCKKKVKEIHRLLSRGLQIQYNKKKFSEKLHHLNIVVTGTLPISREEVESIILKHSGTPLKSVSKNTNLVLAGKGAGSKLKKAQKLGIDILNWNDFQKLIKDDNS